MTHALDTGAEADTPLLFDDLVIGQHWGDFDWHATRELADGWRRIMGELAPSDADPDTLPPGLLIVMFSNYMDANVPPRPPGMMYGKQGLRFGSPARVGDTLTTRMTVHDKFLRRGRRVVELATITTNQRGETVLEGLRTVIWGA